MKTTFKLILVLAAFWLAACAPPTENRPANTNTNTNSAPTAAAPTKEALFEMDKKANEAWIKGDTKHFEGMLSDKFVSFDMGQRMSKPELLKMMADVKCDVKTWSLEDPQMAAIDADTYVVSYKGNYDGTCTMPDGKSMKLPSPIRAASVWVRSGDTWKGTFHGENPIIDPKNPPAAPPSADTKEAPAKDVAKKDDKAPANTAAATETTKPTGSANTDALVKLHQSGWEAWKAKDAKKFEELTAKNLSVLDPIGDWKTGKADVIKHWTTMNCEGITTVKVSDGIATALSPTLEVLTSKGTADGTCDGQKNGSLYHTAFYVKEGDAWKLAFLFEGMPHQM